MSELKETSIYNQLKEQLEENLQQQGKTRLANAGFWIKVLLLLGMVLSAYLLLLASAEWGLHMTWVAYFLFNAGSILLVVNFAHDASHHSITGRRRTDELLSYSWNLIGVSKKLWELQHHFSHHNHTNIPGEDVDVSRSRLIRYSPLHPYHRYFRYQHLYAPLLYMLFGLFVIYFKDFLMLLSNHLQAYGVKRLRPVFFLRLLLTKLVYAGIVLVIPLLLLPFSLWQVLFAYLLTLGLCSGMMLLILVIPHIQGESVLRETNFSIHGQQEWTLHQLKATIDCSPQNRFLGWITGGLNTHMIHHLYPHICHVHYRHLTPLLKAAMKRHGIIYRERSFTDAIAAHFSHLKKMGNPAIRPGDTFSGTAALHSNNC